MDSRDLTKDDYEFVERIINELNEKLCTMTEEERKQIFARAGFECIDSIASERQRQIMWLKAALQVILKLKKQFNQTKTDMEEMIEELGLQGCLIPDSNGEQFEISDEHLRILGAQIDEDVRQCEQAEQESVAQLIKGPKL